jgi:hypothetical protein
MKDNPDIHILENSFTDYGTKETLHWIPISELPKYQIIPEFLTTKLLRNMDSIEHIISKE